jgi:hypothetical protein
MIRFRLQGFHLLRLSFPADSANKSFGNFPFQSKAFQTEKCFYLTTSSKQQKNHYLENLGSSLFARRYLGNNIRSLFHRLLRCFTSAG